MIVRTDDRRLLELCGRDCLGYSTVDRPPERRPQRDPPALEPRRRPAPAVGLGRGARARARARPAPPRRPQLLGDVAARVRHAAARRRWPRLAADVGRAGLRAGAGRRRRRGGPLRRRRGDARSALSVAFRGVIASRLAGFGTTIFTEMSALAERTGAINLGQGFPDEDGPAGGARGRAGRDAQRPQPVRAAARACRRCAQAIAEHQQRFYGIELDPDTQVQVTMGATEAITAADPRPVRAGRRRARLRPDLRLLLARPRR